MAPVAVKHGGGPCGHRRQGSARREQREVLGVVVVLACKWHLGQHGAVVRFDLVPPERPAVERGPGERHDLRAPDRREPAEGTRHCLMVPAVGHGEPALLAAVDEHVVRAVGALLGDPRPGEFRRLHADQFAVGVGPLRRLQPAHPVHRRSRVVGQPFADVDDGNLLGRVVGEGQDRRCRGRARPDDNVMHCRRPGRQRGPGTSRPR
jgi:hypothetical protein